MASQMIRLYGTVNDSIVDGPGIRYVIFTQGCPHHCEGCHNPDSHDMNGGYLCLNDDIIKDIEANPLLDGVTISGGEPFSQIEPLIELIQRLRQMKLHVMIYSGYTYEELLQNTKAVELLTLCDVLVDGRFIIEKEV